MVAPLVVQITLVVAASILLLVEHVVRPRLPIYTLQIMGIPTLQKSPVTQEWTTAIAAQVDFFNANFLHIDVHTLYFDLYASKYNTTTQQQVLQHIGNIQDKKQHEIQDQPQRQQRSKNKIWNTLFPKGCPPLWSIRGRTNFSTNTILYMTTYSSELSRSLSNMASHWWHGSGTLILPITGVAHIRASTFFNTSLAKMIMKVPFTVSIICDNRVDTWKLTVEGLECVMHKMEPGWTPLKEATTSLREYALHMPVNATGGVLQHPKMT
jgi:hypothetical protein